MTIPFPLHDWLSGELPETQLVMRLYQSLSFTGDWPDATSFLEAVYPGYTPRAIPNQLYPQAMEQGYLWAQLPDYVWQIALSSVPGCMIAGYWIEAVGPDDDRTVVFWQEFQQPIQMLNSGDYVSIPVTFIAAQITSVAP